MTYGLKESSCDPLSLSHFENGRNITAHFMSGWAEMQALFSVGQKIWAPSKQDAGQMRAF